MARFAFISDIHGNLQAFEAVLAAIDCRGVDGILCLGDVVGYGPNPAECLDLIADRSIFTVQGNHDLSVIDSVEAHRFTPTARLSMEFTRDRLSDQHRAQIAAMPRIADLHDATMCHASPVDDAGSDYIHDQRIAALAYGGFTNHCLFVGHTHIPIAFGTPEVGYAPVDPRQVRVAFLPHNLPMRLDPHYRYIINPGSVGQPRDGNPDASFGILDVDQRTFTVHRIPYAVEQTQQAILSAGLPNFLAHRLRLGA